MKESFCFLNIFPLNYHFLRFVVSCMYHRRSFRIENISQTFLTEFVHAMYTCTIPTFKFVVFMSKFGVLEKSLMSWEIQLWTKNATKFLLRFLFVWVTVTSSLTFTLLIALNHVQNFFRDTHILSQRTNSMERGLTFDTFFLLFDMYSSFTGLSMLAITSLKSVHFKKTVAWISFLSKLWYFLFCFVLKVPQFWKKRDSHNCLLKMNGL